MSTRPSGRQWPIAPRSAWQPKSSWRPLPLMKLLSPGPGSSRHTRPLVLPLRTISRPPVLRQDRADESRLRQVCDQPSNRDLGDGVMIIIAWLIVVLMTPVDAAAHAPSPAEHRTGLQPRRIERGRCDLSVTQGFPREISGEPPMAHDASQNEDGSLTKTDPGIGGRHAQKHGCVNLGPSPRPGPGAGGIRPGRPTGDHRSRSSCHRRRCLCLFLPAGDDGRDAQAVHELRAGQGARAWPDEHVQQRPDLSAGG